MTCSECGDDFDPRSRRKREVGGLSTTCPECSEDIPKYLGVTSGEGKQSGVQVLKFDNEEARKAYQTFWYSTSGMTGGKQCQMHYRRPEPVVKFKTVTEFRGNVNHKGKE